MKLKILGSSSKGNCHLLCSEDEVLVIECGIQFKSVKIALGFNISNIVGVIPSHVHSDHFKYAKDFEKAGLNVWKSFEEEPCVKSFGGFTVQSFRVPHDVECRGLLIKHRGVGKLLFVTDLSYCPYTFRDLDYVMVEANHCTSMIDTDSLGLHEHKSIGTHMNLDTTLELLRVNNNPRLKGVVLLHLSTNHADPVEFKRRAEEVVCCPVYIAKKGLEVKLSE